MGDARRRTEVASYEQEIAESLRELLREVNPRDSTTTNERLCGLKDLIEDFIEDSITLRFGGSVSRRTYVNGLSDVDALVLLSESQFATDSPQDLLRRFEGMLRQRLPSSVEVERGALAITLTYGDGMQLQLLPALRTATGVRVAASDGDGWSNVIHPERFARRLTHVNQAHGGRVVPLIKIVKAMVEQFPSEIRPRDEFFGSALRAALAISRSAPSVEVVTVIAPSEQTLVETFAKDFDVAVSSHYRPDQIRFTYPTPLSPPILSLRDSPKMELAENDELVLAFGMVEADWSVTGTNVVIDPQGLPSLDSRINWRATRSALVGDHSEIMAIRDALLDLGARVVSPYHDVGFGPPQVVAQLDLDHLASADGVLAVLDNMDGGTMLEIGWARAQGIPVVGFASHVAESDLTMLIGTGVPVYNDLSAAAYQAIWVAAG